jgi:ribonucleoside-diphosphate reductase alpha chain
MTFQVVGESGESTKLFERLSAERKLLQQQGSIPEWYTTQGWQMFKEKYAVAGEDAVRGRHRTIAKTLARHMIGREAEWEERFFTLLWDGVLSPASPALANTGTNKGMPVSCSGQVVNDDVESFYSALRETAILSKFGFGTSADFSSIRQRGSPISRGGKAAGPVPVIDDFFTCAAKISQGGSRRGSVAAYLDIEHADWDEAIDSLEQQPDGKNYGWTIRDSFVAKLKAGDADALRRFSRALHVKMVTGKGYFFFVDKANRQRPQMYKDKDLWIVATNLCTEILLHSSASLTFSCILSSLNLVHADRILATEAVFDSIVFLDCLASEFISASLPIPGLEKVREFTIKGRAIGLGVMGFGTYLQQKGIPYASLDAHYFNDTIFKHIQSESLRATQWLASVYGEPEWCQGYGVRNTHRTALAPTKSTSLLMGGVSESVFPDPGMVFDAGSAVGELRRITPVLYQLMQERGVYSAETLKDIIEHVGSVQHVGWLSDEEKQVFLTAFEIQQGVILRYASNRQKYLCQGQSLNFFVPEGGSESDVSKLMTQVVLDENIISQYYIYSRSGVVVKDECVACHA